MMTVLPHPDEDRLIDLVNGLMPDVEAQAVMAHLETCSECEVLFRSLLRERESLRTGREPVVRDGRVVWREPRRGEWRRPALVAAIVVAVACLAGVWFFGTRHPRTQAYWIPLQLESVAQRSEEETESAALKQAIQSYRQQDATRTVAQLRNAPLPDDEMLSSVQRLVLASAMVNAGQPADALNVLEALHIDTLPVHWREEAQWVEYLALRDAGHAQEARARLERLAEDNGEMGTRARQELQRTGKS